MRHAGFPALRTDAHLAYDAAPKLDTCGAEYLPTSTGVAGWRRSCYWKVFYPSLELHADEVLLGGLKAQAGDGSAFLMM